MDIEERQVAGLMVKIDRLICVGFETCVEVAPDLFQMDEEGIAIFTSDTNEVDKKQSWRPVRNAQLMLWWFSMLQAINSTRKVDD